MKSDAIVTERQINHCHAARPAAIEVKIALSVMKKDAAEQPDKRAKRIQEENQVGLSQEAQAIFPSQPAIRKHLQF